jgi:hypothetical protein
MVDPRLISCHCAIQKSIFIIIPFQMVHTVFQTCFCTTLLVAFGSFWHITLWYPNPPWKVF